MNNTPTENPHLETDEAHGDHTDVVELDCILPGESALEIAEHPDLTTAADHAARVNAYREAGLAFIGFYDQVLAFILEYPNPRLAVWCIAIASGRTALTGGMSQVELADKFQIGKAAVSKCVKAVQARFGGTIAGIEPMPGQRSISACKKFSEIRIQQLPPYE